MYPNYSPNKLILRFFQIYSEWDWNMYVKIEEIVDEPNNPKNSGI